MSTTEGPSAETVRTVAIVLPTFAYAATIFRLSVRASRRTLWWDDAWAFLALLCLIILMVAVLVHLSNPADIPHNVQIAIYYMCAQFFYAVAWSSRLSILFTVIRLTFSRMRRFLALVSVAFFVVWVILFAQVWWVCQAEPGWEEALLVQCDLGRNVAIAQVITDVICDAILIFAPIRLIWGVRLDRMIKIRLIAVFATTSITTAVSLYHAYAVLRVGGLTEAMAAMIQTSISLLVANLTVLVTFFFNLKSDSAESDNMAPLQYSFVKVKKNSHTLGLSTLGLTTFGDHTTTKIEVQVDQLVHGSGESQTATAHKEDEVWKHETANATKSLDTLELKNIYPSDKGDV